MKKAFGKELDKIELRKIHTLPILDLLLELKSVLLLALQIVSVLSILFSKERKEKIKVLIQRLKAET